MSRDSQADFFHAAKSRDANKLEACLQVVGVVNEQDFEKDTALHHLLSVGCFCTNCVEKVKPCLEILFRNNANPNLMNNNEQAPLDVAIENVVPIELIKLLVDNGAKLVSETGINNRQLMIQLIKHSPGTVYEMLNEGVKMKEPSIEKGSTNWVELDWRHLIYEKENGGHWKESAFLYDVFQNGTPEGKQLILTHPLVKAYLERKSPKYWLSFGGFYCTWITVTFILYLTFIWTLYNDTCRYSRNETSIENSISENVEETDERMKSRCNISVSQTVLAYLILILYLLGPVGLELMEFWTMKPKVYFQEWKNYIFFPASALVMVTLYPALREKRSYHLTWQYPSAAIGMLVGSVSILIQLSPLPFVALYLEMLFKTFERIVIAALILSPLFLGFFFSFRILLTKEHIGWFQLVTMIVGDSNYEDMMDEDRGYFYEIVAYFFFSAFILVVIIVVLNLLIGLAVSDVQKLKTYAQVTHLGNKVRSFYVADRILGAVFSKTLVTATVWVFELRHLNDDNNSNNELSSALRVELLELARKRGCSDTTKC